ncbi:hypothetical protein [Paraburkholderia largidicola]|jgi:hypothetical protein|uniref:hypothetical protein n=1 Tax=Paraburkholderia largidicola TaxID=3014751 RepID=UPI0015DB6857|nr:hypothetical protein [Paraburkholderia sp. PGU16]
MVLVFDFGFEFCFFLPLCGWFGFLGACAGVCDLCFCWHPRFVTGASSVAPVRGGTYFSLPPQRKVGKRKRLTPPVLMFA